MSLTILIHSSKTMRSPVSARPATVPELLEQTKPLAAYLQTLSLVRLQSVMHISKPLAEKVYATWAKWNVDPDTQSLAIDSFVGDIYSGLRADSLLQAEREYAQNHLRILSGLYGILRPNNGVRPYRLEMAYKLPAKPFTNLYAYWGDTIARTLPMKGLIVNTSSAEYTRTVLPFIDATRVITPRFLTRHPVTGQPGQVTVHTKIARGAFARWLVTSQVNEAHDMTGFNDLNYQHDATLSTPMEPTFVCETFGGIGLSMRLQR